MIILGTGETRRGRSPQVKRKGDCPILHSYSGTWVGIPCGHLPKSNGCLDKGTQVAPRVREGWEGFQAGCWV